MRVPVLLILLAMMSSGFLAYLWLTDQGPTQGVDNIRSRIEQRFPQLKRQKHEQVPESPLPGPVVPKTQVEAKEVSVSGEPAPPTAPEAPPERCPQDSIPLPPEVVEWKRAAESCLAANPHGSKCHVTVNPKSKKLSIRCSDVALKNVSQTCVAVADKVLP